MSEKTNTTMTLYENEMKDNLIAAITGANLIRFKYGEQFRIAEPYLIGELYNKHQNHSEEGTLSMRAWFVGGYSSKPVDRVQGDRWRIYNLKKMIELDILAETTSIIRPLYNPNDNHFKKILFRVEEI